MFKHFKAYIKRIGNIKQVRTQQFMLLGLEDGKVEGIDDNETIKDDTIEANDDVEDLAPKHEDCLKGARPKRNKIMPRALGFIALSILRTKTWRPYFWVWTDLLL